MKKISDKNLAGYTFIDLFAGLGGFRIALESLGAKCVYSNEWDKAAQEVYFSNFGELPDDDITKVKAEKVPGHDILCAGFPCQAFSISGKRRGFEDSRGTLFFDVARIVKAKRPKIVFLENVKNFASHDSGRTLEVVKDTMNELGYSFDHKVLNALDYGVPQKRERIYMVCIRNDLGNDRFSFPKSIQLSTFLESLLEPSGSVDHLVSSRQDIVITADVDSIKNEPKSIRVGTVNKGGQGERIYSPRGVAITLSAYGGGAFAKTGGYMVDGRVRKLSTRECARVMGFPDSYKIHPKESQAYKQFGNSVVIDVLQAVGSEIGKVLKR